MTVFTVSSVKIIFSCFHRKMMKEPVEEPPTKAASTAGRRPMVCLMSCMDVKRRGTILCLFVMLIGEKNVRALAHSYLYTVFKNGHEFKSVATCLNLSLAHFHNMTISV